MSKGRKFEFSFSTGLLLSISLILTLIIIMIFQPIIIFFFFIFLMLLIIFVSLATTWFLEYMGKKSIAMLIYDYRHTVLICLERVLSVFVYYLIFTFFIYICLKFSIIRLGLSININDEVGLMMFATILSYLPRLSYVIKNYEYSKRIILSIITPLSILNLILFLYNVQQNGEIQMNISFVNNIPFGSLLVFSMTAVFFGDFFIWIFKGRLFKFRLKYNNIEDLFTQVREQNSAIIQPLFDEWKKSEGEKRLDVEKAIDYAYRVALQDIPAYLFIPILKGLGMLQNREMQINFEKAIDEVNEPTIYIEVIKFKWQLFKNTRKCDNKTTILESAKDFKRHHTKEEFCIKLIDSLLEDYKHPEGEARYYAIHIIKELNEGFLNINQYNLSKEKEKLYNEILNLKSNDIIRLRG